MADHRQAILISGAPDHVGGKLLAAPTVSDGTSLSQAEATITALEQWNCEDCVVGLCYDTTASNTGKVKGAVKRLEEMLDKKLLRLECRHHVMELIVKGVATELFGPTSGPSKKTFEEMKCR